MKIDSKKFKYFAVAGASAALVATAVVPAVAADEVKTAAFTDVSERYALPITYLVTNNLSNGLTKTSFGVNETIKRGDAAIILAQALNLKDPKAPASGFNDVPTRGTLAINSLKAAGIINGKTSKTFGFNDTITRGEVALMMSNANAYNFKGDVSNMTFTDVNSRYSQAVAGLMANGITQGVSATKFAPDNSIKRGDFAIFIYRAEMLEVEELSEDFRDAMNGFASLGAEYGYDVVVDESRVNTFNIKGSGDLPAPESGTGFFQSLADQGIETVLVNNVSYEISNGNGTVAAGAQDAKQAIMVSLASKNTVDITFNLPYNDEFRGITYTFNFFPE